MKYTIKIEKPDFAKMIENESEKVRLTCQKLKQQMLLQLRQVEAEAASAAENAKAIEAAVPASGNKFGLQVVARI